MRFMKKKIGDYWTQILLKLPEAGMGYQRVDVIFADGVKLDNVIVYNAEDIELPQSCMNKEIKRLMPHQISGSQ